MCGVGLQWARSAVVARPLCKRKAPGSIPGVSNSFFLLTLSPLKRYTRTHTHTLASALSLFGTRSTSSASRPRTSRFPMRPPPGVLPSSLLQVLGLGASFVVCCDGERRRDGERETERPRDRETEREKRHKRLAASCELSAALDSATVAGTATAQLRGVPWCVVDAWMSLSGGSTAVGIWCACSCLLVRAWGALCVVCCMLCVMCCVLCMVCAVCVALMACSVYV